MKLTLVPPTARHSTGEEFQAFLAALQEARMGVSAEDVAAAIEEWQAATARKRLHRPPHHSRSGLKA